MYPYIIFVIFTILLTRGAAHKLGKICKFEDRCDPYVAIYLLNIIFNLLIIIIFPMICKFPVIWSVSMTLIFIVYLICGMFYFSEDMIILRNVEN